MVYVLSDIHGRKDLFDSILQQINLTDEDRLYVLGDVIDRNHYGIELLQKIMKMQNTSMILGNHEHMMMAVVKHPSVFSNLRRWYGNGGEITHEKLDQLNDKDREQILSFIDALPLSISISVNGTDYLLVHGIPEETAKEIDCWGYEDEKQAVVWERIDESTPLPSDKVVIFGHTPTSYYQECEPMRIWHGNKRIGIDCGAAYKEGRLSCLRLDDLTEFYS